MSIGRIEEFKVNEQNWSLYVASVAQYFKCVRIDISNGIKEELKPAILITAIGHEAYELMANLYDPDKPENKNFSEFIELMSEHLEPAPSEIAERYKFRQRRQLENEPVSVYVATLKMLAKT
ncbi:hypothetical protein QE152_g7560 [Popillia japonica]|uniref:Gag protein n=1 Tax=Popillia japonica TaxID=7064 RepID=A0AAW1MA62_POPJA